MQADADASTRDSQPRLRSTVPQLMAMPPATSRGGKSGWVETFRAESGYVALTVGLDIWSAAWAVAIALWLTPGPVAERNIAALSWLFVPIVVVIMHTRSLYKRRLGHTFLDDFEPVETSVAVSALATLTAFIVFVPELPTGSVVGDYVRPSEVVIRIWVCAAILLPANRLIRSLIQRYLRRRHGFGSSALIVGSGPFARQLITRMRQLPDYGLHPVGVLDDVRPAAAELDDVPYFGSTANLEVVAAATGAKELIVAPSSTPDDELALAAQLAHHLGLRVRVVPRLMDVIGGGTYVDHLGGIPLLVLSHTNPKGWQFAVKHAMGRTIAAILLVLISPLYLTLAILVKLSSPGPVYFRQERVGRDGKVFDCLKFRSMRPVGPATNAFALKEGSAPGGVEGDDRRTPIGKFMRKASLDELPQLVNVLRGDMTLVGPRPERPEFVELFEMQVRRYGDRHRVKAGITGWAQVHGLRGQTSIADRAEFDNYYIENWSLLLDFKIMVLTVLAVLKPAE
ncbi:UDP-phosphate galactose phosphotransferase [Mycolicibacterium novocastrense]|nr:UDP-phosphate galactose phosphotransferase [Mycolicibacterium novocastrense]KUH74263.1 UDP-phosphate galactose phosphotransferase [Mycolicibacterium novocastrense]KUH75278.1 UDP-phosphate galactose phosphotransferase [Mycolicibacterium novocastrense]